MLSDVISNLELDPLYYAKATISFTVKDNHPHPLAKNNIAARASKMAAEAENNMEDKGENNSIAGENNIASEGANNVAAVEAEIATSTVKMATGDSSSIVEENGSPDYSSAPATKEEKNLTNEKRKLSDMTS